MPVDIHAALAVCRGTTLLSCRSPRHRNGGVSSAGKCGIPVAVTNTSSTRTVNQISIIETGPPLSTYDPSGTAPPWGCGSSMCTERPHLREPNITTGPPDRIDPKYPPFFGDRALCNSDTRQRTATKFGSRLSCRQDRTAVADCTKFNLSPEALPYARTDDGGCANARSRRTRPAAGRSVDREDQRDQPRPQVNAYAFHFTVTTWAPRSTAKTSLP